MPTLCECGEEARPRQRTCLVCHAGYMRKYRKTGGRMGKLRKVVEEALQARKHDKTFPEYQDGYRTALRWVLDQMHS